MAWSKTAKGVAAAAVALPVIIVLLLMYLLLKGPGVSAPVHSKGAGDIKIVMERIANDQATGRFQFKTVPPPLTPNAATSASFSLVTGGRDANGAGLAKLHNGFLPGGPDAPNENFFFKDGEDGGRIGIDLNQAMDIRQVNTYSWHTGPRAPQVYKLYASDGLAGGFNPKPDGTTDPVQAGWKLLASVDTRPKSGEPGGQYGVSIASAGGLLGHYRYLLFDCKRTEQDDRWGNTFYSDIDVVAQ